MMLPKLNPRKILFLLLILLTVFLRFYNLNNLTTFTGEEARDYLTVKQMIRDSRVTMLGPRIGPYNNVFEVHLGPFYYYLISPALFLANLNPIGPAILIASLSTIAVLFVLLVGKRFGNDYIGYFAAFAYATAPIIVEQARSSNPAHYIQVASPILLFLLLEAFKKGRKVFLILAGAIMAVLFQLHYTTAVIFVIITSWYFIFRPKIPLKYCLLSVIAFLTILAPQIIFEFRHQFFVTKSIIAQFTHQGNLSGTKPFLLPAIMGFLIFLYLTIRHKINKLLLALSIFIIINFLFVALYYGPIQYHYLALSFAPAALIVAIILSAIRQRLPFTILIPIIFIVFLLSQNEFHRDHGFNMPKGWNLSGIETASSTISSDLEENQKNNLAATLDGDTRGWPYRYFLETLNRHVEGVENYPQTDVLYLISRNGEDDVVNSNLWEIRSFGPSKIVKTWPVQNGISVYKIVKTAKTT